MNENETVDSMSLDIFVLETTNDNLPSSLRTFFFLQSCRAAIREIKVGETTNYYFECLDFAFKLHQENRTLNLFFDQKLSFYENELIEVRWSDELNYKEETIIKANYLEFKNELEDKIKFLLIFRLKLYGLTILENKKINSRKNNFRGNIEMDLFVLNEQDQIRTFIRGKTSEDLKEEIPFESFFETNELLIDLSLKDKLTVIINKHYDRLCLSSEELTITELKDKFSDLNFIVGKFKSLDQFGYLVPSQVSFEDKEELLLEFSVFFVLERNDNPKPIKFLFIKEKEEYFFYPEIYCDSEMGIKIQPKYSFLENENSSKIEIGLLRENIEITISKDLLTYPISNNIIKFAELTTSFLIIKNLTDEIYHLKKKYNDEKEIRKRIIEVWSKSVENISDLSIFKVKPNFPEIQKEIEKQRRLTIYEDFSTNVTNNIIKIIKSLERKVESQKEEFNNLKEKSPNDFHYTENIKVKEEIDALKSTLNTKDVEITGLNKENENKENKIKDLEQQIDALTKTKDELTTVKKELSDLKLQNSYKILKYVITAIITFIVTLGLFILFSYFRNNSSER